MIKGHFKPGSKAEMCKWPLAATLETLDENPSSIGLTPKMLSKKHAVIPHLTVHKSTMVNKRNTQRMSNALSNLLVGV